MQRGSGSGSNNNGDPLAQLLERFNALEARLAASEQDGSRSVRDITPANSTFGETDFKPTGSAADPTFKPYGID